MKKELSMVEMISKINGLGKEIGGIFTFSDLWNLIGLNSSDRTAKTVKRLLRQGILIKVRRDLYATREPDLWILASRFKKNAYISMDSVLAKNGLIGTLPERSVSLVFPGNTRTVETLFGRLRFFKIKKSLIFGIQRKTGGITMADNEKAYLDLLYYYLKGARFVIDPLKDVDLWKLDSKKLLRYLRAYKNPKFVQFVRRIVNETP